MYQRYIILLLLVATILPLPSLAMVRYSPQLVFGTGDPLIEARLKMEIASAKESGTSAILEFKNPLSEMEIVQAESLGIDFARRGNTIISVGRIYSATVHSSESLRQLSTLGLLRATSGTKQYVPSLTSSVPAIRADEVWSNLQVDGQKINGSGVTVAVIDTGIVWTHPAFWRQFPGEFNFLSSGPDYYLDLNNDSIADPNEGPIDTVTGQSGSMISYASDYMYIDVDGSGSFDYTAGDRWIGGIDANHNDFIDLSSERGVILNVSKVSMLYDQETSSVYVRGVNLTLAASVGDSIGHGTHVASTIAGGQPGLTSYVGVAPGADLIIVRSPLQSADIIDGINFAIENGADIMNMSFSSYLGFLDGTDLEDLAVSEAFLQYGVLSTAAAGNLGTRDKHARFSVSSGSYNTVGLDISNEPDYSFLSLLWQSEDSDEHIILSRPSTDPIDLGKYSEIAGLSFSLDTENLSAYVFCETSIRGMNNIIIQVSTAEHDWLDGHWTVRVENPEGDTIDIDAYAWDGDWGTSYMTFSDHIDNLHTISGPATADFAIAVASSDKSGSTIASSSSEGPRIDGSPKPDIAAPGVSITAAKNSVTSLWTSKSGTSMASPHIAGTLALIRQAEGMSASWKDYTALMNGAGGWTSHFAASSTDWGHGFCDAAISVMHVLNETLRNGSAESDWALIDPIVSDFVDSGISPDLDILSVKMFQQVGTIAFAITTASASNFSEADMLSLEWDTDTNDLTGINGADVVLNLTGNTLSIFEWSGSSYTPSSLAGYYWQDGAMTVLKIEGLADIERGDVVFATHNATMSYVDQTSPVVIMDRWRPLITGLEMTSIDSSLSIALRTEDRDSSLSLRIIGAAAIDGSFEILQSSVVTGQETIGMEIDPGIVLSSYVNSLLFNVTSESEILFSPPVILSTEFGSFMRFVGATLDSSVIRVGLLYNERISGEFTLQGYLLASEVLVAFRYSSGLWFNFTLSSSDGFFEFTVAPIGFPAGDYDAYAVAKGTAGSKVEVIFGSLLLIEDNTLVIAGFAFVVVAILFILLMRKQRARRGIG
jgi:subtilisin family serine protease